jgi:DNA-binding NtrC family response regulator
MVTRTGALARPRFTRAGAAVRLVVLDGPDRGAVHVIDAKAQRIGSAGEIVLVDPAVSRLHAEVRWLRGMLEVVDLGSKNGTFVDACRIYKAELACGAELRIGSTVLKVVPDDEVLDPAASAATQQGDLVAASTVMRQLFTLVAQLAASDVSILIEGETGVGKEVIAQEIHRRSPRAKHPFEVFDCGAVPDELVESMLFGHVRGAFTGASADRAGVFGEADRGVVFLDEIGELDLGLQPVLLRALDRRMIKPVGGNSYRAVDVRVIAATHRDLGERIDGGLFREDLYYRLAVVRLVVPALRDRREDIPLLVERFVAGRKQLEAATLSRLVAYDWPGNVRELRNAIEGAVALSPRETLELGELGRGRNAAVVASTLLQDSFRDGKAAAIETFERRYLSELMARHPTVAAAADASGMDRKHLRVLLRRHNLRDA